MIGYLEGLVIDQFKDKIIVKISSGIGYEVTSNEKLNVGQSVKLFVSYQKRETSDELFGFRESQTKRLFELLLDVKGIGPKSAYSILTSMNPQALITAVACEDKNAFKSIPGVGPKTAAQIILDLASKIRNPDFALAFTATKLPNKSQSNSLSQKDGIWSEAMMAFKELGIEEPKVLPIVNAVLNEKTVKSSAELVEDVLKRLYQ